MRPQRNPRAEHYANQDGGDAMGARGKKPYTTPLLTRLGRLDPEDPRQKATEEAGD